MRIATVAETLLRIFVAALDIIVLAIIVFCSVRFEDHYVVTYVATSLMALWCAWATCRGWGIFNDYAQQSVSLRNELFCVSCGEFILLALFIVSTLSVALSGKGNYGDDPDHNGPYAGYPWRMYAVWFQVTICVLQFFVLIVACASCWTARRRQRTDNTAFAMTVR